MDIFGKRMLFCPPQALYQKLGDSSIPKDVHVLVPRNGASITSHGKGQFKEQMKTGAWEYLHTKGSWEIQSSMCP